MVDDRSVIRFTPDGYDAGGSYSGPLDLLTIDCSDLGGLGLYTSAVAWSASIEVFVVTNGYNSGYHGISHLLGSVRGSVGGALAVSHTTFETSVPSSGITDLDLILDTPYIHVRLTIGNPAARAHTAFVVCKSQNLEY